MELSQGEKGEEVSRRVMGLEVEKGAEVAEALAGMPRTMARLSLPVWKEETLNALRSVIRGGADQVVLVIVGVEGEGGSTVGVVVVVTVRTSVTTWGEALGDPVVWAGWVPETGETGGKTVAVVVAVTQRVERGANSLERREFVMEKAS